MHLPFRAAACLASLLLLSNCSTASEPDLSRAGASIAGVSGAASQADVACLAEAVYFEAGGSTEGQRAVARVVVNRTGDPRFPGSICGVIAEGCQFSYRCDGRPDALAEPARRARAYRAAQAALAAPADPTRGALFFHAAGISPGWFSSRPRIGAFGGNVFYR